MSLGFGEGQHLPLDCKFTAQIGSAVPRGDRSPCAVPVPCHLARSHPSLLPALFPMAEPHAFQAIHCHVATELSWQCSCLLQRFICFPPPLTSADLMPATDF